MCYARGYMKIVSWNCNGKFREKFSILQELDADIYVIQECENPELCSNNEYVHFASNYFWTGINKNKGLAIFAKDTIVLKNNNWNAYCLRNFLSINIDKKFDLVGVWACKPYIEEYYIYQNINYNKINNNTIIIGDFNSNKKWDKKHYDRNHSNVVNELKEKGLISAYHYINNEEQGEESKNTFYLYRHLDKGYHIDYCFIDKTKIKSFEILYNESWLKYSDHLPIMITI